MSQTIAASPQTLNKPLQRCIQDSFTQTKVQQSIFNISSDNKDKSLLNEILTANKASLDHGFDLIKHGGKFDNTNAEGNFVESLPLIKIDFINNNGCNDWGSVFTESDKPSRKDSLTISQPEFQESPFFPVGHVTVSDARDIPTSYLVPNLAPHEKAAVGTFVDPLIIPGYPYRVRLNGSDVFLFDEKPLILKTVGQGYGKRLTFSSEDILNNDNYFWSDSNPPDGFALSLGLEITGEFRVRTYDDQQIGRSAVNSVNGVQIIQKVRCSQGSAVALEVLVKMACTLSVLDRNNLQSTVSVETTMEGVAIATKTKHYPEVHRIENIMVAGWGKCVLEKIQN